MFAACYQIVLVSETDSQQMCAELLCLCPGLSHVCLLPWTRACMLGPKEGTGGNLRTVCNMGRITCSVPLCGESFQGKPKTPARSLARQPGTATAPRAAVALPSKLRCWHVSQQVYNTGEIVLGRMQQEIMTR